MRRWRSLAPLVVLSATLLLTACAAPEPLAPARQKALSLNQRGVELQRGGDHAGAARLFGEAATQAQAIEYEDGLAQALLNLARTLQAQGKAAEAEAALARLLDGAPPAPRRAEALLQRALLVLQAGAVEDALRWHGLAQAACPPGCALDAALLNLGARLALERGDFDSALRQAEAALPRHRAAGNRVETANALRLAGAAELARGRQARALPHLEEALALDKALALADKICHDLILLGAATEGAERRAYWRRALAVASAAGMEREVRDITTRLASLPPLD